MVLYAEGAGWIVQCDKVNFFEGEVGVYEFTEEAVAEIIEEVGKELEEQERQSV